ncbi:unnamed protein product [Lepidochelys olivacea]
MQGTAFSRMEWKSINCMKKFVQIQTDIIFLSKCKQMDIVPKGLKVKNPLQSTYHTDYADSLCHTLSKKLRNHLINILYSKQGKIKNELSKMDTLIKNQPSTQTSSWLDFTKTRQAIYNAHFASLQKKKDTKLSKLLHATRGHSNGSLNPPSNIVNLSNYTLSPAEAAVLSRGLSFCPSTPTNMIQFCGDLESYFRRLRLKEYFQNTSEQHTNPQRSPYQHYRKRDSRWTPPEGRNSRLDFYIECFRRRARAEIVEKQHHLPHNLSHAERNAIHSLRNNSDIIIKKADKGGAVVVMNRSEYEQEAARQLSNTSFYKPLPSDPTESYQKQLQHLLKKLPEKAQDQIRTDTPLEPRPGIFYLLPKIHKPGNPGRPIISGIGTLTAGLSGYVDSLLRPYATSTPSYLRDTTDFLRKLQSIGDLPDNTILATMDVEALYTNIPHKDGLQAVKNTIPDNVTANLVAELCDFVLTHNYFTFGDNVYLQISGTAMGTRMAPQYANIFMADLEQRFLSTRPLKPLLYLRYIDDIFIIWTHGKEALEEFHHDFNNFHPTTNLSLVQSTQEIHFLDTTVLINNGHINTTLYRKPTDRYSYLHASSFHPDHTTRSINLESERNGILLCDWDCVYNEVVSLLAHMDDQDKGKIALRIAFIAETKLASVLTVLLEKLQKDEQNRIDIYYVLEKLLQQDTQGLERRLLKKIITLASNHMTETQEARNEVKVAASNTLVTLARCYFSDVMLELVYHLELPEEFIFMTLGNLSSAYALKCIPFVGMILKAMISMLALVKDNRMRQAFCGVLEKCSRAVNVYFMNWEKCPFPRMGESQFCKNILPLYSHVTSNWLSCEELELKKAVIKALGPMMGILLHKKEPQNPIFKEISWLLEQYKEEIDVFHVTKRQASWTVAAADPQPPNARDGGETPESLRVPAAEERVGSSLGGRSIDPVERKSLSQLLEVSGEYKIPLPKAKFQAICRALHNQICSPAKQLSIENHKELFHCVLLLARSSPDDMLAFLHKQQEIEHEAVRVVSLELLRAIVGADLPETRVKKLLIVKSTLSDQNATTQGTFDRFGSLIGRIAPYSCDSLATSRQWVVDCISCLLCIQGQSINLGSAEEELRCLREALTAPDPEALFQASSKMARVVSEYFPSEQATDFIEATLGGLLSASPTCATAAGLWMKIILKECGGAMLDEVPDILAILYRHMPTIQEGSLRQFLVEAVSILAHHHQEAVISSLLSKRLPMDSDTAELWRSLGGDPLLATQVLRALIEKIKTPARTEGNITSETEIDRHLAAAEPLSATCAIFEVVSALQSSKAVRELLPELFPVLLQQVSQTLGQKLPLPTRSSPSEIRKGLQLPEGNPCR